MTTDYRIYIDDCGNVDLSANNDPNIRYGSITAVILEKDYLEKTFNPAFDGLVERNFGKNPDGSRVTLHRRLLSKPPAYGPFAVLQDAERKKKWDAESLKMYDVGEYTVISATVDKVAWYYKYPNWDGDFYEVLVQAVLERAFYFLRNRNGVAEVNIETKNPERDKALKERYKEALVNGYNFITPDKLRAVFSSKELNILKKADGKPGMQLADLLAAPAMQHNRFLNVGRHPIESPYVQKIVDLLEKKKYYREQAKGPKGLGRIWRPL